MVLTKRSHPIGRMEKGQLNMLRCLHLMDMGCRNIYLMDSEGRFTGEAIDRAAIKGAFLRRDGERGWAAFPASIGSIQGDEFEGLTHEAQGERLREKLEEFPSQEEFPVLDGEGQILYVISKAEEAFHIHWERAGFPEEFRGLGKLYLSSLGHDNMLDFYIRYHTEMPMEVLSEGNFREALSGDGTIVYNVDLFPDCRKVSIVEAVRRQDIMERERAQKAAEAALQIREEEEAKRREADEKRRREEPSRKRAEELRGITDATAYFRALGRYKEHYLVCVAVKDTFFQIPAETAEAMAGLGMENLCRPGEQSRVFPRCWQGYIFVMDAGRVILNKLADVQISLFEEMETSGIDLQLISRPYEYGNVAKIVLNGCDFSTNVRGLNVVVFDLGTRTVVDSVGFDFYHPDKGRRPCSRLPEGIGSTLPPKHPGASRVINKEIKRILPIVHIAKEWAAIREDRLLDMSQLIEKFDEGYHSVSIVDSEGRFLRLVNRYQFAADFPKRDYRTQTDLYVEYEEDEERLKWKLARMFLGTPRKEIPILKDGKIVGLGRYSAYFDMYGNWIDRQVYRFRWDWIDEGVAREFFVQRRKILISSNAGWLKGFREAFSKWLDITVYEDCVLNHCIANEFDIMLHGSDVFGKFPMEKWPAHQLYIMMLRETVRRWLSRKGVVSYFFALDPDPPNIRNRMVEPTSYLAGMLYIRDGEEPYFITDGSRQDLILKKDKLLPNMHSGRRITAEADDISGNAIHFYGPCVAVGFATYSSDHTIESCLQRKLNAKKIPYHVVNSGSEGFSNPEACRINHLYRVMDTPLRCGDIVVMLENYHYFFGRDNRFSPPNLYRLREPFMSKENAEKKYFYDPWLAHMNVEGYELAADYILQKITKDFSPRRHREKPFSFFSEHRLPMPKDTPIARYLEKLPKGRVKQGAGGIVVRTDSVLKSDIFHMKRAMEQCDILYVFLSESEDSLISMECCLEILRKCLGQSPIFLPCGVCDRQRVDYYFPLRVTYTDAVIHDFNPVADTYTFARYIAPRLGITKRFVVYEPFDEFERRYNILRREMLAEEGIEYVEIPRMKLPDGGDIITGEVRRIWREEGWRACTDYLQEEALSALEEAEKKAEEKKGQ